MCNMKNVTVREVRQEFSRKVEGPLRRGEALVLRKRHEILGHIIPEPASGKTYPISLLARRGSLAPGALISTSLRCCERTAAAFEFLRGH